MITLRKTVVSAFASLALTTVVVSSAEAFPREGRGFRHHALRHHHHGVGVGTGLAIGLGAALVTGAIAQQAHAAPEVVVPARPRGIKPVCNLSLDHYLWTRDNARRRYAQWRDEIGPDNPARASQMKHFRSRYNHANACVAALGGAPQAPLA